MHATTDDLPDVLLAAIFGERERAERRDRPSTGITFFD
jgi:hypothetical protein